MFHEENGEIGDIGIIVKPGFVRSLAYVFWLYIMQVEVIDVVNYLKFFICVNLYLIHSQCSNKNVFTGTRFIENVSNFCMIFACVLISMKVNVLA